MFTTPGVPLKDDSPGGLKTQNASADSEPMLLYARLRGHVSASGPVRLPSSASAMSLSTGAGEADWLDAVKVGRTFGTTGPLLLLSVNDFGGTGLQKPIISASSSTPQ